MIITAGAAAAHTRLVAPVPRTNDDGLKDGVGGAPCGGKARNPNAIATYTMGQTVQVRWEETINHAGCFIIKISQANDQNFQMLANPAHSTTGATPRQYMANVALPAGMTCTACTLQLIQVMTNTVPCPTTNIPTGDSYYSCADVVITAPGGTGGGSGSAGGSGGSAGGMASAGGIGTAGGATATAGGMSGSGGGGEAPGDTQPAGGSGGSRATGGALEGGGFAEGGCSSAGAFSGLGLLGLISALRLRRRRP